MTKDMPRRGDRPADNDEFLVQHLVDPNDWVADHERTVCNVCTRAFGTFRRKHHCRMCGEVVCSGCTLHKNAHLSAIGYTRVRVCISCIFNGGGSTTAPPPPSNPSAVHAPRMRSTMAQKSHSPRSASPTTQASDESSRRWLSNHLHSPLSQADHDFNDPADSPSADDENYHYNNSDNQRSHGVRNGKSRRTARHRSNQDSNDDDDDEFAHASSPLNPLYPNWTHPWPKPPVPYDEVDRLEALAALQIMDTSPEKAFDMICDLAKARLACPMAAVSFMDEHRQWFKSSVGLAHKAIPRKIAFCAYTICAKEPAVVLDTLKDKRFDCNPLVSGAAAVRFYAAAPIIDPHTGYAVGSVFVLDTRPRESCDVEILERLAQAAGENLPRRADDMDDIDAAHAAQLHLQQQQQQQQQQLLDQDQQLREDSVVSLASQDDQIAQITPMPTTSISSAPPSDLAPANLAGALATSGPTSNGESMEVLLMRLLTQNTETQQQLATQQMSLNSTINHHSVQISRLMNDVARMEAKIDTSVVRNRV